MVRTYYLSKNGNPQITKNIRLWEMRSPGADKVLLDDDLCPTIERIRDGLKSYFNIDVTSTVINAGYRTSVYDRQVGGSGSGPHTTGKACDFYFRGKDGKAINSIYGLCVAQLLKIKGIERIMDGVSIHIDVNYRNNYWWAWQTKNSKGKYVYYTLSDFFTSSWAKNAGVKKPSAPPTIIMTPGMTKVSLIGPGSTGPLVEEWQRVLKKAGYDLGTYGPNKDGIDGHFDKSPTSKTYIATKAYQIAHGLKPDLQVGAATWKTAGYECK